MIRRMTAVSAVLSIALFVAFAGVGCGDDDDDGNGGAEEAGAGETEDGGLTVDPESGPAGTTISWTIAGCEASDDKGVAIYTGPLERYESGANSKRIIEGPDSKKSSGTITVPDDVTPGEYVIAGSCLSTEELGGGQVQLGVREETVAFTVTE